MFDTARRFCGASFLALFFLLTVSGCGPESGPLRAFLVTFELATADADVEELDFVVTYIGGGLFTGEGTAVNCDPLGNADAASTFDDDDTSLLTFAVVSGASLLEAGDDFASCAFEASVEPTTGNFTFGTVTATDGDGASVVATITVTIDETFTSSTLTTTTTIGSSTSSVTTSTMTTSTTTP